MAADAAALKSAVRPPARLLRTDGSGLLAADVPVNCRRLAIVAACTLNRQDSSF